MSRVAKPHCFGVMMRLCDDEIVRTRFLCFPRWQFERLYIT